MAGASPGTPDHSLVWKEKWSKVKIYTKSWTVKNGLIGWSRG